MIPILYDASATSFSTNGIGRLTDCIECIVTEERNGAFELEMQIATTTPFLSDIAIGNIIAAVPYKNGTRQAFEIQEISKPINQIITVRATHISYRASYIPVSPFLATGITNTLTGLDDNAEIVNPFTLTTDFTNTTTEYDQLTPKSLRACLGGTSGSVLDLFGGGGAGEYLFDNFTISFLQHRGADNGVYLRYSKNITEFEQVIDFSQTITGCLPFWTNEDNTIVIIGTIQYSTNHSSYAEERIVPLDLSSEFATAPSSVELDLAAQQYLTGESVILPNTNITLSFVDLSDTGELTVAENINLCDTVHVIYQPLGVTFKAKVIKTVWDVLKERYDSIEIGTPKSDIAKTIATAQGEISSLITQGKKMVSVTQQINTEIGSISSAVATVQSSITEVDNRLSVEIQTNSSLIQQNADEISLMVSQEDAARMIGEVNDKVTVLQTHVTVSTDGLKIKQNDDGSYVLITDDGMKIFVDNNMQAYATSEGFNASTYITGDWHIQPANNGNSLNFFKKEQN